MALRSVREIDRRDELSSVEETFQFGIGDEEVDDDE